jgi:hypothetical protein
MKFELIYLNGFAYAVDKENQRPPCKDGAICFAHKTKPCDSCGRYQGWPIIATTDPSLNLPLLPAVEEDNVFNCILTATREKGWKYYYTDDNGLNQHSKFFKIESECRAEAKTKIASPKQFTEEDIRKAFKSGINWGRADVGEFYGGAENERPDCDEYIQSLKPKPVAVDIEMCYEIKRLADIAPTDDFRKPAIVLVNENNIANVLKWYYEK